jgi:hypothetical protein
VGDEVFRVQQKVTAERTAREAAIVLMKDDFYAALKVRALGGRGEEGGWRGKVEKRTTRPLSS